jgi:hypothetical protein
VSARGDPAQGAQAPASHRPLQQSASTLQALPFDTQTEHTPLSQ